MPTTRYSAMALAALLLLMVLGVAACSSEPEEPTAPAEQEQTVPEPAEESEPPSEGSESGAADGEALVEQKCTLCHTLDRVDQASKSADEWSATVDRMVGHGLVVTDDEKTVIVDYLAQRDEM
jgi:mono/diheme cytochrome c family protein